MDQVTKTEQKTHEFLDSPLTDDFFPNFIIAIGASAGGLAAITEFFKAVDVDSPHTYVVIQHLSPDHKSMMPELLAKSTDIPINVVSQGLAVKGNHIYLIPVDQNISLNLSPANELNFVLSPKPTKPALNLPIDLFFSSLAQAVTNRAIGIILSGSGEDGSQGVRAIRAMQGVVFVQEPTTAEFQGMPQAAIDSNMVDFVLPPEQIPAQISQYIVSIKNGGRQFELLLEKDVACFNAIIALASESSDSDFSGYRKPMLRRRIAKRVILSGVSTLNEYLKIIEESNDEQHKLAQEFLVGVTHFFRDPEAWQQLKEQAIPTLFNGEKEHIKVWSAGCSSGEEAYSLAILFDEYISANNHDVTVKVYATDMDEQALVIAQRGVYPASIAESLSSARLERYFSKTSNGYEIKPFLRQMIIFSKHNLVEAPPFVHVDLLVCRNLLIYLNNSLQEKLISSFGFSLVRNGLLFLGPSEKLGAYESAYVTVDNKWRIFRSKKIAYSKYQSLDLSPYRVSIPTSSSALKRSQPSFQYEYRQGMLDCIVNLANCCAMVVDEEGHLLDTCGQYKRYLSIPDESFSNKLVDMLPSRVANTFSLCLRRAKNQGPNQAHRVIFSIEQRKQPVQLQVFPLKQSMSDYEERFIVVLKEVDEQISAEAITGYTEDKAIKDYVLTLESELANTQNYLELSVEDLQATNEELHSTNEELLSSNEELQSTYEEMQSVNEELHTLNAEYQYKNAELSSVNADMSNLLESTKVAVLFIDEEFTIRKFTPAISSLFKLRQTDIGRPIQHFMPNLKPKYSHQLTTLINEELKLIEMEVESNDGDWYQLKIMPFVDGQGESKGAVMTFFDINTLKSTQEELEDKTIALENVLEGTMAGYWDWYIQDEYEYMSPTFKAMFGYRDDEIPNHPDAWQKIIHPEDLPKVFKVFNEHVESKGEIPYDNEVRYFHKNGAIVWVWCRGKVIEWDEEGNAVRMVGSHVDITATKNAEFALAAQSEESRQLTYIASHDLREPLNTIQNYLNVLQTRTGLSLNDTQASLFEHVLTATKRLSVLISDLLDYAKLEEKDIELVEVDLNVLLAGISHDLQSILDSKQGKIEISELPVVQGNTSMLRQVFQNVVANGIKFCSNDRSSIISISARLENNIHIIDVVDNGIGIEARYQNRIFDIFQRLHTHSEFEGSGVGLAIAKKVMRLHKGDITVDSVIDQGSTFSIILPK